MAVTLTLLSNITGGRPFCCAAAALLLAVAPLRPNGFGGNAAVILLALLLWLLLPLHSESVSPLVPGSKLTFFWCDALVCCGWVLASATTAFCGTGK